MKKLTLVCAQRHSFAGWFASDDALAQVLAAGSISCPDCGSTQIAKGLQVPNIPSSVGRNRSADGPESRPPVPEAMTSESMGAKPHAATAAPTSQAPASRAPAPPAATLPAITPEALEHFAKLYTAVKKVQEHVKSTFDDVGTGFAEEARKIHYGEADERGIYGSAQPDEVEELKDEGIDILPLPTLPKMDA